MKQKNSKIVDKALGIFARTLRERFKDELVEVKLFGSRARGDSRPDSDADILIVLKSLNDSKQNFIIDEVLDIGLDYGLEISPHVYSLKRYRRLQDDNWSFMQIINREGRIL